MNRRLIASSAALIAAIGLSTMHPAAQSARLSNAAPQVQKRCLHGPDETAEERARREEALATMRMIDWVLKNTMIIYPKTVTWPDLQWSTAVRELRAEPGRVGELAAKIRWGAPEPLPGWTMQWDVAGAPPRPLDRSPVFALTDARDPCAFRYVSTDPEVMREGFQVRPLDSY